MFRKTLSSLSILLLVSAASGQTKSYDSPNKAIRALIVPVGAKGCEASESRVDIRSSSGKLLQRRSFASKDHNHGEGVGHGEWTADGWFFIFNTNSSGGHQPWHYSTYLYSTRSNRFYNVDSAVGPITSDFRLRQDILVATRLGTSGENIPVTIRLARWR